MNKSNLNIEELKRIVKIINKILEDTESDDDLEMRDFDDLCKADHDIVDKFIEKYNDNDLKLINKIKSDWVDFLEKQEGGRRGRPQPRARPPPQRRPPPPPGYQQRPLPPPPQGSFY